MLDLHCHILFDLDDGAPNIDCAVAMARALVQAGFATVAASPHLGAGPGGDVTPALASERRAALTARLLAENIPLTILPNAEHHVTPELLPRLKVGGGIPIGGQGRWLLVELPWHAITDPEGALFRLQLAGYRLLLAHPERYSYLTEETIGRLVERDVKMQLELGSFVEVYGRRAKKIAHRLTERGLAHVLATDLHRPKQADMWLEAALHRIRGRYGDAALRRATESNPGAMLRDAQSHEIEALLDI